MFGKGLGGVTWVCLTGPMHGWGPHRDRLLFNLAAFDSKIRQANTQMPGAALVRRSRSPAGLPPGSIRKCAKTKRS
jgi:hypothetical protein